MARGEKLPIILWDQAYNRNGDSKLPRTVMNAIRTYMDNRTLEGWVRAQTLAEDTGLQERAVWKQIAANVKAGWLQVVKSGNSSGLANRYRLTIPEVNPVRHDGNPVLQDMVNPVPQDRPTTPNNYSIGTTPKSPVLQDMVEPALEGAGPNWDEDPFASSEPIMKIGSNSAQGEGSSSYDSSSYPSSPSYSIPASSVYGDWTPPHAPEAKVPVQHKRVFADN
jgi:hypothetical protein